MAEIRICDRNNKLIRTHRRSYRDFPKSLEKERTVSYTSFVIQVFDFLNSTVRFIAIVV